MFAAPAENQMIEAAKNRNKIPAHLRRVFLKIRDNILSKKKAKLAMLMRRERVY
jgi:hypothetical protein